ncbi:hypothetical protein BKA93DRAFT_743383, partial [Sparassis latifolia]
MSRAPPVRTIVFCADNSSAIETITANTAHPGQSHSIKFCKAVSEFLEADERNQVVVRWTPGHHKIDGNEKADELAKEAA